MTENKVEFGLKKVFYVPFNVVAGVITYETPIPLPGGVSLTLDPRGDLVEFYADDMLFYTAANNNGYDGKISIPKIPESFAIHALGEEKDEVDGVLTEKSTGKSKPFALLFEFDGDVKATRHVLYSCNASRPSVASTTKTNTAEPNVSELSFVAAPRETDYAVKTKTTASTTPAVYDNWYTEVYEKKAIA